VGSPEVVGFDGLGDPVGGYFCISPSDSSVAVSDGPVALFAVSLLLDFEMGMGLTFHAGVP
jgi:hypothetical protein